MAKFSGYLRLFERDEDGNITGPNWGVVELFHKGDDVILDYKGVPRRGVVEDVCNHGPNATKFDGPGQFGIVVKMEGVEGFRRFNLFNRDKAPCRVQVRN